MKTKEKTKDALSTGKVIYLTVVLTTWISVALYSYSSLPQPNLEINGHTFSTSNARAHLTAITNLGIRNAGSVSNDIKARDLILEAIAEIKAASSDDVDIDVSVQNPSGSFHLTFLGGMTHVYDNLTNVIVRFNPRGKPVHDSLLVNCHFDSAIGTPAASDDAVSCAIMLEMLRCLSTSSAPTLLDHAVIFLFNGAEEMVLPASHGFITQHPWAKEVRAFINMEAAGAGGKEIVFQTGPKHPWVAKAYAQSAVYPYGSVFGEEVFQSGVIPGDTDFRIFRDFGGIPGVDMAYFINGYVYHTEYDLPEAIPDGSIQRAGENVLSLIKEMGNSPYLANPGDEKNGKVIYFDFIGIFMVVYTHRVGIVLNCVTAAIVLLVLWSSRRKRTNTGGLVFVFKTALVLLLSEGAAILSAIVTASLTSLSGHSLSYYSKPYLIIPLFYVPAVLSMGAVHYWWRQKYHYFSSEYFDYVSTLSGHLLWLPLLMLLTYLGLSSAFVPFLFTIFPVLFWTILWHKVLSPLTQSPLVASVCFSLSVIPVPAAIATAQCLHDLFIPITGRSGTEVLPDFVVGVMSGSLVCLLGLNTVPTLVHYSQKWLLKTVSLFGCIIWALTVSLVVLGLMFPYSASDPIAPKRLFAQHTRITHHNSSHTPSFTGILIHPLDTHLINHLLDKTTYFKDKVEGEWPCNGIYCGIPQYFPVAHMLKKVWYISQPKASIDVESATLELESITKASETTRNYTITAHFPNRGRLYIEPLPGFSIKSWSLTDTVPSPAPYGDSDHACHYISYVRGIRDYDSKYLFWIEIMGDVNISPSIELAAVSLYLEPPLSTTPELDELMNNIPDWSTCVGLTSTLDSWKF